MRPRIAAFATIATLTTSLLLSIVPAAWAAIPLETSPAWTSAADGHYATGGAWADVDNDGWLDMVVSNGNDMARQTLAVYRNQGDGTFPAHPSWSATDIDYHGKLDCGDIDGDGFIDVAVGVYIGAAGFDEPGRVKVYLNDGAGAFHSTPDWVSDDRFYCFSVALGDADGDGDLDLACACGDDYYEHAEHQRVYFNNAGMLASLPAWQSSELGYALDVVWGDIEDDGDMDLAFCGTSTPMRVYRNAQTAGGGIATTASWENSDTPQAGNTVALGDWNGDRFPELAVADNNQLGGQGLFKVYANAGGVLSVTPAWVSQNGGYGSHVSWADLDLDGDADLLAGRWWGNCRVYENTGGALTPQPVWTSATSSVIENMFLGDVDRDGVRSPGRAIASGDGARTFFPLGTATVLSIDGVWVNGVAQPASAYAAHLGHGWISFDAPPPPGSQNVTIHFTYSVDLDLGVTTWDANIGNYLFLNTGPPTAVPELASALSNLRALPNPLTARTWLQYRGPALGHASLRILDVSGRVRRTLHDGAIEGELVTWEWNRLDDSSRRVENGTYFACMEAAGTRGVTRLVVIQ